MPFLIAFVVAVLVTPVASAIGARAGVVDRPGELKIHDRPVPVTGGFAVAAAALAAATLFGEMRPAVAGAVLLVLCIGAVDDVRPLPAWVRVAGQVGAGILLVSAGLRIEPFGIAGAMAVIVSTVAACNAVNMVDGQDGLAAGTGALAALALAAVVATSGLSADLPLATAGASLGFLLWNRPPARVFLGDGGAYAVGVLLVASAASASEQGWTGLLAAGACLGVFAYELCASIVRRARQGSSPATGDRDHLYDRLASALGSRTRSTFAVWALGLIAGGIGVAVIRVGGAPGVGLVLAALTGTTFAEARLLSIPSKRRPA
jgi:UDP-GlcNAc:undecaprenyl-phosphate GlcNAc-1-phosphate transferase